MIHRLAFPVVALSLTLPSLALAQGTAAPEATPAPAAPTAPATPAPAPVAPTPAPEAPAATTTERPGTYTIEQGDSLWTVAHKNGTTVVKLRALNHLKKGALLHPGQVIQLPPAEASK